MKEGWYILVEPDTEAHFVFVGGGDGEALKACTMKGVNVPTIVPWLVTSHVGRIPLCKPCMRYLNPPPEGVSQVRRKAISP